MELLHVNSPMKFDTKDLESKLKEVIKTARDDRIVKPASFLASLVMTDIGGFYLRDIPKLTTYNALLKMGKRVLVDGAEAGHDATFLPVIPKEKTLEHQSSFFIHQFHDVEGLPPEVILKQNGVIGSPDLQKVTYLKRKGFTDYTGCGDTDLYLDANSQRCGDAHILFDIDTTELLKTRTVFRDPEGLVDDTEYMQTYLLFGGIPLQTVKNARVAVNLKPTSREFYEGIIRRHHSDLIEGHSER